MAHIARALLFLAVWLVAVVPVIGAFALLGAWECVTWLPRGIRRGTTLRELAEEGWAWAGLGDLTRRTSE